MFWMEQVHSGICELGQLLNIDQTMNSLENTFLALPLHVGYVVYIIAILQN